jgi:hypothetical protein
MWNASAMPFFVEYTVNQKADIRSAVDGDNREDALATAADTVSEAGCRTALLHFAATASTSFGNGDVIASYTETEGWETP